MFFYSLKKLLYDHAKWPKKQIRSFVKFDCRWYSFFVDLGSFAKLTPVLLRKVTNEEYFVSYREKSPGIMEV